MATSSKVIDGARNLEQAVRSANPSAEFRPVARAELSFPELDVELTDDLRDWYGTSAPVWIEISLFTAYMTVTLYDPTRLVEAQAGYRWNANTGASLPDWRPSWLVIGDWDADPIIARLDQPQTPIYIAMHGGGEWRWELLAPSLSAYLEALTLSLRTMQPRDMTQASAESFKLSDEHRVRLTQELIPILGAEALSNWFWSLK